MTVLTVLSWATFCLDLYKYFIFEDLEMIHLILILKPES